MIASQTGRRLSLSESFPAGPFPAFVSSEITAFSKHSRPAFRATSGKHFSIAAIQAAEPCGQR